MGVLTRAITRRARVTSGLHPEDPMIASMFVDPSDTAGMDVTPETAQTIATVWACVTAISEDCAKLPIEVVRHEGRNRTVLDDDPLSYLLNHRPNPYMTAFVFRELLVAWAVNWHGGFAEIQRDGAGTPVALWPIPPWRVTVTITKADVLYEVQQPDGGRKLLGSFNMIHVRGRTYDGVRAMGVIAYAKASMGITIAADRMSGRMMANSFKPSGVLKWTVKPDPKGREKAVRDMETGFLGANAKGGILDIPFGAELTPYAMTAEDAEFLGSRKFQAEEICRWYRMPPPKVGILDRATFSNIEEQSIWYTGDTLGSWFVRQETEWNTKLVGDPTKRLEHNDAELLRGNAKARMEYYAAGRQWGLFSRNDCRRMENMEPVEGGDDDFLQPVNMVVAGSQNMQDPHNPENPVIDPAADGAGRSGAVLALRPAIEQALRSCAKVEASHACKAVRSGTLQAWASEFYPRHQDHVRSAVMPFAEAAVALFPAGGVTVAELSARMAKSVVSDSQGRLGGITTEDQARSLLEGAVAEQAAALVAIIKACTTPEKP